MSASSSKILIITKTAKVDIDLHNVIIILTISNIDRYIRKSREPAHNLLFLVTKEKNTDESTIVYALALRFWVCVYLLMRWRVFNHEPIIEST